MTNTYTMVSCGGRHVLYDVRSIPGLYPINSTSTLLSPPLDTVLCSWKVKLPRVENHDSRIRQSWVHAWLSLCMTINKYKSLDQSEPHFPQQQDMEPFT